MQGISDIITIPGLVNVDFADVKAIMCNSGTAMLGVGVSSGKNRAEEAALVRVALILTLTPIQSRQEAALVRIVLASRVWRHMRSWSDVVTNMKAM